MNRTQRRAATRKDSNLAAEATMSAAAGASTTFENIDPDQSTVNPASDTQQHPSISDAKLNANRANAQFSSGPRSSIGKSTSSLNAVKTGLTSRTVLLPSDDAVIYQKHLDRFFAEHCPITDTEKDLVQSIADTNWRLLRIAPLEASIYAIGRETCANHPQLEQEKDPVKREGLLLGVIFLAYRKELNNIALQERRLRNHLDTDLGRLQVIQKERVMRQASDVICAKRLLEKAKANNIAVDLAEFGFDFSVATLEAYWAKSARYAVLTSGRTLTFDHFLRTYSTQMEAAAA